MDPVGLVPVFIAMTARLVPAARRRAALRGVIAAGGLLVGFALIGRFLLEYLHVSVEALSISGGLLLLLVALEMLRGLGVALLAAEWLARALPASFVSFLTRVFGLLLSAIAVQLVVDGIRGLT